MQHGFGHPGGAVVGRGERPARLAKPVGFVVRHQVAVARTVARAVRDPEHDVQRAVEVAAQQLAAQGVVGEPVGVGGQRISGRQVSPQQAAHVGQPDVGDFSVTNRAAQVTTGQRELEVHLAQPIRQSDPAQGEVAGQRAERCVVHRHQRGGQVGGRHVDRPPHRVLVDMGAQFGSQVVGERVGGLQHRVHEAAELRAGRHLGHRRRDVRTGGRSDQRHVGHLVVEFDDFGLAAHPGCLLRGAHQTGVGRAPPAGVDAAVEVPHREVAGRLLAGQRGDRGDQGLLDRRTTLGLPLPEPLQRLVIGEGLGAALIGNVGLTGQAAAQQPGQTAVGFVPGRRPPGHQLGLRAGHRDVHQPAVVTGGLATAEHLHGGVVGAAPATDVQASVLPVVEQHLVTLLDVAVEREGQVDDRELQTLAPVHGQHLNRRRVALQPLAVLGAAPALVAAITQPVAQGGQGEVLGMCGFLQQLGHVRHIGHVPLAVAVGQRAFGHPTQPGGLEHRGHPAGPGVVGPLPDGFGDGVGQRVALGSKVFGGVAEEHRGSGGADHTGPVRLVERLQHGQPVVARLGVEHIGVTGVHRRNAGLGQCGEAGPGVLALLHDHRDVGGLDRSAVEGRGAGQ